MTPELTNWLKLALNLKSSVILWRTDQLVPNCCIASDYRFKH
jgi:hypothetical protein